MKSNIPFVLPLITVFFFSGCSPQTQPLPPSMVAISSALFDKCSVKKITGDYVSSGCLGVWGNDRLVYAVDVVGGEGRPVINIYRMSAVPSPKAMNVSEFLRTAQGLVWPGHPDYSRYAVAFTKNDSM